MVSNGVRMKKASGSTPDVGAIFMSNKTTIKECFEIKLFGLPHAFVNFVKKIKAGMALFLFEYEERVLHGVFQATTDGTVDIVPHAYHSSGKLFPAQVRFCVVWDCYPLLEHEFCDAIKDNYFAATKFNFGLSKDQVQRLLYLFYYRKDRVERSLTKSSDEVNPQLVLPSLILRKNMILTQQVSTGASASSSFSGDQSFPLQGLLEHKQVYSYTSSSDLGDYIPLSSPEHCDPTDTEKAFSETCYSQGMQTESNTVNDYEDLSSGTCIFPIPLGPDLNQQSSAFSQSDGQYQKFPVDQSYKYPLVKGIDSDAAGKRTSVFSRLNLSSIAALDNEEDSEVNRSVHEIMEKFLQSHNNWQRKTQKTRRNAHEKSDSSLTERASVFSRLNFVSKNAVAEKEICTLVDKSISMSPKIFWEKKKRRGCELFIGNHHDGKEVNMAIKGRICEESSQVEEDPDDSWNGRQECIPLKNFSHTSKMQKTDSGNEGRDEVDGGACACLSAQSKKRRLVRPIFRNMSDIKTEIYNSCPKEISASKENGGNYDVSTKCDVTDENQSELPPKEEVPAVILPNGGS